MRILVTGGSGFIGSHLVSALVSRGHQTSIFDKAPSEMYPERVIQGDVRDLDALTAAVRGNEAVFHLAAEHRDDVRPPSLYEDVNVGGARNLVRACETTGCRKIVFTSSVAVYPLNAGCPSEETEANPFNDYGRSKLKAEGVFREFAVMNPDVTLVIVRPCVVFGEKNRGNVYNLLNQIQSGRFLMIGNGNNKKSLAYVGNVVLFLTKCLEFTPSIHLYNYADKPDMSTRKIVETARICLGQTGIMTKIRLPYGIGVLLGCVADVLSLALRKPLPVSLIRVRKFCADTSVSTDRLEKTGFERAFSLEEALLRTIKAEFQVS